MSTLFTGIINGDIPSFKIKEDALFYAFLDIRPISPGHTLVIPKYEVDHFFDMSDEYMSSILSFSRPIVRAIELVVPCLRVGAMVAGLEVPHAHLHLVPIVDMKSFSFANAAPATNQELDRIHQKIISKL